MQLKNIFATEHRRNATWQGNAGVSKDSFQCLLASYYFS
jgi:hypothetical protein